LVAKIREARLENPVWALYSLSLGSDLPHFLSAHFPELSSNWEGAERGSLPCAQNRRIVFTSKRRRR